MKTVAVLVVALLTTGCQKESTALLGTLEWDRIGVAAEASEPIMAIDVVEGQQVTAGTALLHLDPRHAEARIAQASAQLKRMESARPHAPIWPARRPVSATRKRSATGLLRFVRVAWSRKPRSTMRKRR